MVRDLSRLALQTSGFTRLAVASLKVGLKDRICCAYPRGFVSHNDMEKLRILCGPHQPGLVGNPFFDAATPGHSCCSASFLSWHVAWQQRGGGTWLLCLELVLS